MSSRTTCKMPCKIKGNSKLRMRTLYDIWIKLVQFSQQLFHIKYSYCIIRLSKVLPFVPGLPFLMASSAPHFISAEPNNTENCLHQTKRCDILPDQLLEYPDLHVYLATNTSAKDYVDLGKLKANIGNQNYDRLLLESPQISIIVCHLPVLLCLPLCIMNSVVDSCKLGLRPRFEALVTTGCLLVPL